MGKNNRPAPLMLVEVAKEYKSIYNITFCCGLSVVVEPLRPKNEIIQCRRCQLFGHSQKNCHADYKCMKCSESHSTHLCSKPKTTPAKCSNCGGEHTSKAIFCPENPNNIKNKKTAVSTAETSKATPTSTISNDTPNLSQRPNPWLKTNKTITTAI